MTQQHDAESTDSARARIENMSLQMNVAQLDNNTR